MKAPFNTLILQIDLPEDSSGEQKRRDRVGYLDIVSGSCEKGFASVRNGEKRVEFFIDINCSGIQSVHLPPFLNRLRTFGEMISDSLFY